MVWVQLVIATALFVVGTLLRKSPDLNPAAFEDFGFPDVDPTKRIPIVWGKKRVKSVHTMEVQGYRTRKIKQGNFLKKTTVGFKYLATVAVGICRGPDVTVTKIILGNKVLWEGSATPTDAGFEINVSDGNFFGDNNGVAGTIRIYPGTQSQTMNAVLAAEHDALASPSAEAFPDIPYRGICYAVFEDFYWGNAPQIPQLEFVCERYPNTLGIGSNRKVNTTPDESPSEGAVDLAIPEIVHEILTNDVWGLGESSVNDIDTADFTSVAATLRSEGNAASLIWNQGDSIRELLATLMRQANGFVYKRMSTGLWEMNLAREDYLSGSPVNSGEILTFDETNSNLIRYSRGNWDETFNSVVVNWQDRNIKGRPAPAIEKDLANYAIQNSRQEVTYDYPGVHSATLAQQLAANQRKATSYPLATAEITTGRLAFDLVPGDIVEFQWDKLGISRIFMRINKISLGTPEQGEIRVSLVQDVFGLADTIYSRPVRSKAPTLAGEPINVARALVEDQSQFLASQDGDNPDDSEKPRILAQAPQGNALDYIPHAKLSTATAFEEQDAEWGYALTGTLQAALAPEDGDSVSLTVEGVSGAADLLTSPEITAADVRDLGEGLILIETTGSPSQRWVGAVSPAHGEYEILAYTGISVSGTTVTLTGVQRGLEDTVPMRANVGDRVWFISGFVGTTVTRYADSDTVNVRLENIASTGSTGIVAATTFNVTMRRRLDRPFVPGYLRIDGQRYPAGIIPPGDIEFTWRRRNKDNASIYFQTDADDDPGGSYVVDLDIYESEGGTLTFLRTISANAASATYTKSQQLADGGPFNRYTVVLRAYDESESPRLASLGLVRQWFRYNPLISPLPSPTQVAATSPISPKYSRSPVPSPISPLQSPRSPAPSPVSPLPSPEPPKLSPRSPARGSPVASPLSPVPSPLPPAQSYRDLIISDGPEAYWRFNDAGLLSPATISPAVAVDEMGSYNGNYDAGANRAPSLLKRGLNSPEGFALRVDKSINSRVVVPSVLTTAGDYTFEFWIRTSAGQQQILFDKAAGIDADRVFLSINRDASAAAIDEASGKICLFTRSGATFLNFGMRDPFPRLLNNKPHHVVVVMQPASSPQGAIYIDGVAQPVEGSIVTSGSIDTGDGHEIGGVKDNTGSNFVGDLDEFAIYTKALTASQVLNHYNLGIAKQSPAVSPRSPIPSPTSPLPTVVSSPAFSPPANYQDLILAAGPRLYYRFEETTGLTAVNETRSFSPVGDGTYNGASPLLDLNPSPGIIDAAFDARERTWVTVPEFESLLGNTGTIEFWFRPNWNGNDGAQHDFGSIGGSHTTFLRCTKFSDNNWYVGFVVSSTNYRAVFSATTGPGAITAGETYHLAFKWSNTTGTEVFINGVSCGTSASATGFGSVNFTNNTLFIGKIDFDAPSAFYADAIVDEWAFYQRQLTDDEILSHYNFGRRNKYSPRPSPIADYPTAVLIDDPLSYHRMEELQGLIARNLARRVSPDPTRYEGVYLGTSPIEAKLDPSPNIIGSAFDGTNEGRIEILDGGDLFKSQGSFEFWFRPNWNGNDSQNYVLAGCGVESPGNDFYFRVQKFSDNNWYIGFANSGVAYRATFSASSGAGAITSGNLYHMVVTWNEASGGVEVFINGTFAGSNASLSVPDLSGLTLYYGTLELLSSSARSFANADIDEIAIYDRRLTNAEITEHYNIGSA